MSQASAASPLEANAKECLHCGNPLFGEGEGEFCCRGCASVHAILNERGLSEFYAMRGRTGSRAPGPLSGGSFAYLDDPQFLGTYASDDGLQMRFYLEGAHCAACVWLTEKLPDFAPGVESLSLNLASGVATVRIGRGGSFARAAEEVARMGYRPHPVKSGAAEALRQKEDRDHLIRMGVAGMASGNIMLLAIALYAGAQGPLAQAFRWVSLILYLPVFSYAAVPFYRSALGALRQRQISIDVPIVLGLAVGTVTSVVNLALGSEHIYFDSLAAIVFLLLATRYLLRRVNGRAARAIEVAHFAVPAKARRFDSGTGKFLEAPVEALQAGDLIEVLPGGCFPVDGLVTEGRGSVDCSLLTGESEPVIAEPGSRVSAGTWNQQAPLRIRVEASGSGTRLGAILSSMERSLSSKAPIVSYLDRVGRGFVLAAVGLTGLGFLLGLGSGWHEAINRALAVAIVVCPCAFALAAPLATSLAISRCAKAGVLVKGADVLERLARVRNVFFDKTGTLTRGEPRVVQWEPREPDASRALLALEEKSNHPISRAVRRYLGSEAGGPLEVSDFEERPGKGLSGRIGGSLYEVESWVAPGNAALAGTRIGLFKDRSLIGSMVLADQVRPDSAQAVAALRGLGLEVHLASGDSALPVQEAARKTGIPPENAFPSLSPEGKAELLSRSGRSLMVGDGANDAIALASAYASVAVQGGMDVSLRAAGAYSAKAGISSIPSLLITARETLRVIHRNLVFAVAYNGVGIAAALTGRLNPLFAAALMPVSALTVFLSTIIGTRPMRRAFAADRSEGVR